MDTPPIQYTKTSDGVSLAYATHGTGRPLVTAMPLPWSQLTGIEMYRYFWSQLDGFRVIMFDWRGCGYSDRSSIDFSQKSVVLDLEAAAALVGDDPITLVMFTNAVPPAIEFAAKHPERVTHLILGDGFLTTADYKDSPAWAIEESLRDKDWELLTETFAQVLWRYEDPALVTMFAELTRASCSPEAWRACWDSIEGFDASPYVHGVRAETLVLHNKNNRWVTAEGGQRVAASIAGAQLLMVDDMTFASVPALIREFVLGTSGVGSVTPLRAHGTAIILFADIAESTALTERLGDVAFREKARELDGALRRAIAANGGTAIEGKLLGDGVLATFDAAHEAIAAAAAMHGAGLETGLTLHVGIHAGDVIREKDNVYGGAVNLAARVASEAAAGETLVSATVRDLARTSAGVSFEDRGESEMKGVEDPMRVFAVR